jgi:hypothetical protein
MTEIDFAVIDRLVQWLIIPAIAFIWALQGRVGKSEREILRILTILEERNVRRDEDRQDSAKTVALLHEAITKLNDKLDLIMGQGK